MRRSFMPDKHWLLLTIFLVLLTGAVSLAQAQAQPTQSQPTDQTPAPGQNQEAQGADQIQPQDKIQEQDQVPATPSYDPNSEEHYSHARIVRISYIDGQVRIDHGQGYESATMNVPVAEHNWMQTRSDGWAEVQFEDGSIMRLAPDTVVAFTELSRSSSGSTVTTIDLDQGEAEFKVLQVAQSDGGQFQVTVKNKTVMLDRAASFRVTSTNADPLEVAVWKGEVAIRDSESGGEVAVKKNETFVLDPTDVGQYALDKGAEADALDQWSQQRDDYLSTYASRGRYSQSPYQYGSGDLNYYGDYFDDPSYGTVWQPSGVSIGWDPFGNGYWAYEPGFGYTWVSAYPWGWLPYRYGHWVFIAGRGWCWVPGNWHRWHTGPTWVNAPPGFRPPAPPPANKIAINRAPGGRVPRTNAPGGNAGIGVHKPDLGAGNSGGGAGRSSNRDGDNGAGPKGNRRIFTNEDIARVPRTDIPKTDVPAKPAPNTIDADRKPKQVERQPDVDRFHGDHAPPANRIADDIGTRPSRSRSSDAAPPQSSAPVDSRPVRQPAPPVREYTQPAQQPVRQSAPAPAPAPARQSAPPAAASTKSDDGSRSSNKPK